MKKNKFKTCLISFLFEDAFIRPLSNLESILNVLDKDNYLILGTFEDMVNKKKMKKHTFMIFHKRSPSIFVRSLSYLSLQFKMALSLIRLYKKIDICILFMDRSEFFQIVVAKMMRKKVIWILPSFFPKMKIYEKDKSTKNPKFFIYLQKVSYFLTDKIVVYSNNLIKEWGLNKYESKILIAHEHVLDFDKFKIKNFNKRSNSIAYVGRLSEEKGILNFLEAINILKNENLHFYIIGDGYLRNQVETYLNENNLTEIVQLIGWVENEELPTFLNTFKLIVIPSYTEGLPNILLESIACGAAILATPVGAIPDIIKDNKTGFIMRNNSPKCIASNIKRSIEYPKFQKVVDNAHNFVQNEYTSQRAIELYEKILKNI